MATANQRLGSVLERETPTWGIRPVPDRLRRLGAVDLGILWGDLSIGLLVLVSGALLVPALGLPTAAVAIVVGSLLGCLPLALMAYAGAREGVPGMVLFRPLLGLRGSWLPSAVNLVQLVGWTTFEFWAMARVANAVGRDLLGFEAPWFWLGVVVVVCTALALAGPLFVVRRWLERFGIWVVVAVAVWITVRIVSAGDLGELWRAPGTGGLPFWLAVDLVIAMPVSWLPLVADYNRFARDARASATGTFVSYAVGNIWFYLLGALLVLAAGSGPDVLDVGTTIAAAAGGAVVLVALLVGESDQAMANIYSGALSVQNVAPRLSQRGIAIAIGVIATAMAAVLQDDAVLTFEFFLFLIGSVFVPLVAVFAAHYLVRSRGRYGEDRLFEAVVPGVRAHALVPWAAGFGVFQWCVPTGPAWWTGFVERVVHGLHLPFPLFGGSLGASLPSFVAAFAISLAVLPRVGATTRSERSSGS
ncbi:MAG: cytosine permease [Actinobacteria bacterium]|nr:cytosine permease [Actinomycetota bacterium]